MNRVVALLAAVLASVGIAACGGNGAEPGAPRGATLVLDFQPNAVHAGIYSALREGYYSRRGVDLEIQEPSASTDAPKLLEAGRAEFAILDIHDLAIAFERGFHVVGVVPIVQRPLAAVIAADRESIGRPRDLEGKTVGVTGLPSDDAVLDSVLEADGAEPSSVRRVTIGFQAVSALAAGRIDAATAFWNAEGVALRRQGIPTRVFRVDDHGAPRYPELWLCTSEGLAHNRPGFVRAVSQSTVQGYRLEVEHPARALDHLLTSVSDLEPAEQRAQLRALLSADAVEPRDGLIAPDRVLAWLRWEIGHGILEPPLDRPPQTMFSAG
jgi:NitT/TauT family transport system substrate-binding protein/putative hydroxymethylpyrimidine transport system substrate-binding protein